jgi:hypothetical protein
MEPREITRSKDINVNPTKKSRNAGPRPWELEKYIYQEKPTEEKGSSHSDPRLELAWRQHQESDCIPSDEDDGYGPSVLGNGFMPGLDAHASFASDLGTLAGGKKCRDRRRAVREYINWVKSGRAKYDIDELRQVAKDVGSKALAVSLS